MEMMKPEKAVEILKKHGQVLTLEQAKLVLDFIYKLANIAVAQVLKNEEMHQPAEHKQAG